MYDWETLSEDELELRFLDALEYMADLFGPVWRYGDGDGGWAMSKLRAEIEETYPWVVPQRQPRPDPYVKRPIPGALRKKVFERDAYRCVECNGWEDLTVDHIVPESMGGPTELDNLQAMCRSCNSRKGARV